MNNKRNGLGKGLDSLIPDFYDEDFDSNSTKTLEDILGESKKESEEKIEKKVKKEKPKKTKVKSKINEHVEEVKEIVAKNPRITLWSVRSASVFRYLRKTEPEFSISKEASKLIDEAVSKKYPEIWELFE